MAQTSEGKRKTKSKAKVASPMQAEEDNQLLRASPMPARPSEREQASASRSPSRTQPNMESSTGPSDGAASARYGYDLEPQGGMESDDGRGADMSIQASRDERTARATGEDAHSRIAERAFFLYAEGGFQHGHDLDHWLEAERDITIRY